MMPALAPSRSKTRSSSRRCSIRRRPATRFSFFSSRSQPSFICHGRWGDLHDGVEGQFAGGAREMLAAQQGSCPQRWRPAVANTAARPLVIVLSYKISGDGDSRTSADCDRDDASIALTFLIGERLAGYERGFAAGLIHLCCAGAFLLGRGVRPSRSYALIAGAIFVRSAVINGAGSGARGLRVLALRRPSVPEQRSGRFFYLAGVCVPSRSFSARLACVFVSSCIGAICFSSSRSSPLVLWRKSIFRIFSKNV